MKKRSLLVMLGLCVVMLLTGCESLGNAGESESEKEPTLEGKWVAEWDLSELIVEAMGDEMEAYADCFKNLKVEINFKFTDDEVEMSIDEKEITDLVEDIGEACCDMFDAVMTDMAEQADMNIDDIYAMLGTTRDAYLEEFLKSLDLEDMVDEMTESLEAEGEYEYDEDDEDIIIVTYEDGEEEEWEIDLDDDELTIKLDADGLEIKLECERK